MDETRMLRNAQSNLISLQSVRIAQLEAKLDAAMKAIDNLQKENDKLKQAGKPTETKASC